MQTYSCVICKKDSSGGGSLCYGGMFFKMCAECLEDEEIIQKMNEMLKQIEEDGDDGVV